MAFYIDRCQQQKKYFSFLEKWVKENNSFVGTSHVDDGQILHGSMGIIIWYVYTYLACKYINIIEQIFFNFPGDKYFMCSKIVVKK